MLPEYATAQALQTHGRAARKCHLLAGYDLEMVVEALRRDMRHQEILAHSGGPFADDAAFAARKSRDLLELLNPKNRK